MKRGAARLAQAATARAYSTGLAVECSGSAAPGLLSSGALTRLAPELERVPLLVRTIWGRHSEAALTALRESSRHPLARQLLRRWEAAELRLIAVANSLASKSGQKVVGVGIPLAAAHLMGLGSHSHAYSVATHPIPAPGSRRRGGKLAHDLRTLSDAAAAGLRAALTAVLAEVLLLARALYLAGMFAPLALTSPALWLGGGAREAWMALLARSLAASGPAFIKWAQWAATRPDLFPADACEAMAALQTGAPAHGFAATRVAVETALGAPLEQLFDEFDEQPAASGSIAQIHRAVLSVRGATAARAGAPGATLCSADAAAGGNAAPRRRSGLLPLPRRRSRADARFVPGGVVAVKVRHPGVDAAMERDIALMQRAAALLGALGAGGQLRESVMQFGAPLREQLDLSVEAEHLRRFSDNFAGWEGVRFPLPAGPALVARDVLVETFEEGELISRYLAAATPHNRRLAGLGLACYLKMLLRDNFVHADMHPGNILVQVEPPARGSAAARLAAVTGWDLSLPRLILLDVGMAARLTPSDQIRLVDFFRGLTDMDGRAVADAIVAFSAAPPPAPARAAFRDELGELFDGLDAEALRSNTSAVVADLMDSIRRHGVQMQGAISTVIITTCVLEGWSTRLDPGIRILESLRELLPGRWDQRAARSLDASFERGSHLALAAAI